MDNESQYSSEEENPLYIAFKKEYRVVRKNERKSEMHVQLQLNGLMKNFRALGCPNHALVFFLMLEEADFDNLSSVVSKRTAALLDTDASSISRAKRMLEKKMFIANIVPDQGKGNQMRIYMVNPFVAYRGPSQKRNQCNENWKALIDGRHEDLVFNADKRPREAWSKYIPWIQGEFDLKEGQLEDSGFELVKGTGSAG